ncbi:AMP-binding protein [Pantoea sp. 1.19]|uniref:AMP-binding protein n=1 Tax=Pantoea sp. 1.19 TaxID=1925589 RepID=UPI000948BF77|nr:AMP-binding protein [Pantoea sp. 1.19]
MTLFSRLAELAIAQPARPALCDARREIDYASLWQQVQQLAQRLRTAQVQRLALALDNGPDWAIADLAAMLAGIVVIPLPPFFTAAQQQWVLESSGADALIGAPRTGWRRAPDFSLPLQRCQPVAPPVLPAGTAKITYTSGSTGQPKGVCLSLDHLQRVSQALADRVMPAAVSHHLTLLPLATLLENISGLYVPLLSGVSSRIPALSEVGFAGARQFSAAQLAAALQRWQPHSLVLVPELLRLLVMVCQQQPALATSLRLVAVGGGKVSPALVELAQHIGIPLCEGYGLSECGSVVALNAPGAGRPGTAGQPLPHCEVTLAADGEILVRGAGMLGYLGDAPAPVQIATGDLGQLDADGYLTITGRKKNIQITAWGRNFAPEWVEAEAQLFPAIGRLLIFGDGLPANVALIQPTPGGESALAEQVMQLNQRLPDYAQVHHYLTVDFSAERNWSTANGRLRRAAVYADWQSRIQQCVTGESA